MQGNSWQQIIPSGTLPGIRFTSAAAWSDAAGGMYIFGGQDGSPGPVSGGLAEGMTRLVGLRGVLNDLWLFNRQAGSEFGNTHDFLDMERADGPDQFVLTQSATESNTSNIFVRGCVEHAKKQRRTRTFCFSDPLRAEGWT